MPKLSLRGNDYNNELNKNNLTPTQINFPILGIFDFVKFNFSKINDVFSNIDGVVLTPFNLPKRVKFKLHRLCIKQGWSNDDNVFESLKIPFSDKINYSPFNYKYVFDYVSTHQTFIYTNNLCVEENVLLTPADQENFKLFYSL